MTITQQMLDDAWARLRSAWDKGEGECASCGWSALLGEHEVEDADLGDALAGNGWLKLGCLSKDDPDAFRHHRGVRVYVGTKPSAPADPVNEEETP